jgi:hypothetical protein
MFYQIFWITLLNLIQGSQTCDFLATLCKFSSLFCSPVNIYIDAKQKLCSEIRVLHTRIRGYGSPEGVFLPKIAKTRHRTEVSHRNCDFFVAAAGIPGLIVFLV